MISGTLPHRLADFSTLAEGLDYAAQSRAVLRFYSSRGEIERSLSYAGLREAALATAKRLTGLGLERGSRIGLMAATGPDFLGAFYGCQYAGLIPCPLPHTIYLGGREAYTARIAGLLNAAGAGLVVSTDELLPVVGEAAKASNAGRVLSYAALAECPEQGTVAPFGAGDAAYIQYSSGSTSTPKGVLISQRAILANTRGILTQAMRLTPEDRSLSWLPLYHDMGLVGFSIAPMLGQCPVDYLSTSSFARRPALWLKLISDNAITITYAPSFGYELAAKRLNGEEKEFDLSCLRIAGIGGDMIRAEVLEDFAARLAISGFRESAFLPSYGMAEATLAVSFARSEASLAVDAVDRKALKHDGRAVPSAEPDARRFTVCGRPLGGHDILVAGEDGEVLPERVVGRILIRGPSLMTGYFGQPEASARMLREDGFLDSGDLGYRIGEDLVVTGRAKDLILHNGRNIWPQDVEWAVERLPALRSGDVAAFAVEQADGREQLTVLVECRLADLAERKALNREIETVISRSQGVIASVVLVEPKSLPFTSSGKLSRSGARARYLAGEMVVVG